MKLKKKFKEMKRDKIIIHCADTRTDQSFSIKAVKKWHTGRKDHGNGFSSFKGVKYKNELLPQEALKTQGNGWSDVGYHYYIRLDGTIEAGRDFEKVGIHCKGENSSSVGICFEGGKKPDGSPWDKPTAQQIKAGKILIREIRDNSEDELTLCGHFQFSTKSCPNFDPCILEKS